MGGQIPSEGPRQTLNCSVKASLTTLHRTTDLEDGRKPFSITVLYSFTLQKRKLRHREKEMTCSRSHGRLCLTLSSPDYPSTFKWNIPGAPDGTSSSPLKIPQRLVVKCLTSVQVCAQLESLRCDWPPLITAPNSEALSGSCLSYSICSRLICSRQSTYMYTNIICVCAYIFLSY